MSLFHPWAVLLVRVVLGGVMVYASWHKIADPGDFAKIIFNYKLFPAELINPLAIYVPWLELLVGLGLITGIGKRGASFLAMGFFATFIVLLSYNLARECPTICGCFDTHAAGVKLTAEEKFAKMRFEIWAVDVPCLLGAAYVFVASWFQPTKNEG